MKKGAVRSNVARRHHSMQSTHIYEWFPSFIAFTAFTQCERNEESSSWNSIFQLWIKKKHTQSLCICAVLWIALMINRMTPLFWVLILCYLVQHRRHLLWCDSGETTPLNRIEYPCLFPHDAKQSSKVTTIQIAYLKLRQYSCWSRTVCITTADASLASFNITWDAWRKNIFSVLQARKEISSHSLSDSFAGQLAVISIAVLNPFH